MIKIKNIKQIDVSDWDELVSTTYGKIYDFQQQDGCQDRGSVHITIPDESYEEEMSDRIPEVINGEERIGVKFDVWLKRDPNEPLNPTKEELENCNYYRNDSDSVEEELEYKQSKSNITLFWQRSFYPNLQTVANDLHKRGLIEAGDYSIKIDW